MLGHPLQRQIRSGDLPHPLADPKVCQGCMPPHVIVCPLGAAWAYYMLGKSSRTG